MELILDFHEIPEDLIRYFEPVRSGDKPSLWTIATAPYSGAHFATFPPKLVEPMIKAGTSERGACPECGAPWARVREKTGEVDMKRGHYKDPDAYAVGPMDRGGRSQRQTGGVATGMVGQYATVGWEPSCDCGHEDTRPCLVLDPFCGSGTVGVVCQELGREFVGIDLSWEYLQLARERTGAKALDEWENGIIGDSDLSDLPMFRT